MAGNKREERKGCSIIYIVGIPQISQITQKKEERKKERKKERKI